jgi:hypothetical protein
MRRVCWSDLGKVAGRSETECNQSNYLEYAPALEDRPVLIVEADDRNLSPGPGAGRSSQKDDVICGIAEAKPETNPVP